MTGKDIRLKIEKTGVQYNDVATRLGLSPQAFNSRLNGKDLKLSFIQQVADAINKPLYYLFEDNSLVVQSQGLLGNTQIQHRSDDQAKKIIELESRLRDKEETIIALKKLVDMYESRLKTAKSQ